MLTETLRIKPQLDNAAAADMERRLSGRFTRIAKRFGGALRNIGRGTVLGISVAVISRLLNPLKEVEERIKKLTESGMSISDQAEKFNTDAGTLMQMQAVGKALGFDPGDMTSLMSSFQEAVLQARKEFANPDMEISDQSRVVSQFLEESDIAVGFRKFLDKLAATESAERERAERTLFGAKQTGAARRFIDSDMGEVSRRFGIPSAQVLNPAAKKGADLSSIQTGLEAGREANAFVNQIAATNKQMIMEMNNRARIEDQRAKEQIDSFHTLAKAASSIDEMLGIFRWAQREFTIGLGYIIDGVKYLKQIAESKFMRYFSGGR